VAGPEQPNDQLDTADPLYRLAYQMVIAEKVEEARRSLPAKPKYISGQRRPHRARIPRFRQIAAQSCVVSAAISAILFLTAWSAYAYVFAALAVLTAVLLGACLLGEVLYGAGWDVEGEYIGQDGPYRVYSFQPSIQGPIRLFALLGLSIGGIVVGFAEIYLNLSLEHTSAFSKPLDGVLALYFSVVTFATVGYGDIYPNDRWGRLLVSGEVVLAMFAITVVLATSTSWVLSQRQQLSANRAVERERETQYRERVIKNAGLGLYENKKEISEAVRAKMEALRKGDQENPS
jgi:hypothetical protein